MTTKRPSPCHDATPELPNELMLPYYLMPTNGPATTTLKHWPLHVTSTRRMKKHAPWKESVSVTCKKET